MGVQAAFEYYEIENTVSETGVTISGRYTTLEAALRNLRHCSDWYAPIGTGTIYRVWHTVAGEEVTKHREKVELL